MRVFESPRGHAFSPSRKGEVHEYLPRAIAIASLGNIDIGGLVDIGGVGTSGGPGSNSSTCGEGGNGVEQTGSGTSTSAASGGGAVGRIRLNADATPSTGGLVSPAPG